LENTLQGEREAIQQSEDKLKETTLGENSKISMEKKISESKIGVEQMEKMLKSLEIFEKKTEADLLNIATSSKEANAEL
jgi:hypothetical protein